MARKTVSIKEKRAEAEAAEKTTKKKKKKKAAAATTKKVKRKSRKKAPADVRLKAYWGVFNQSLKRLALYEYSQRRQAEKKAEELSNKGHKSPHFVQPVKEVIQEE